MLFLSLCFLLLPWSIFTQINKYTCSSTAKCGCSTESAITSKIIGGETVIKHSWGWMVSLRKYSDRTHFCGGSILSKSWILTAAHCVADHNSSDIMIHAGSLHLQYSSQTRTVERIISHPNFNSVTFVNDIALIKLSSPLDMNDINLAKICLPSKLAISGTPTNDSVSMDEYPPVNSTLVAIGWGKTSTNSNANLSNELQQVTLSTIDSEDESCSYVMSSKFEQFCAGVHGGIKDTSEGDSGGPLMKFSSRKQLWILAGISSAGHRLNQTTAPGLYTRVVFYFEWINTTIEKVDRSGDPIIFVKDYSNNSGSIYCAHYHSSPLLFSVIFSYLSLYFM